MARSRRSRSQRGTAVKDPVQKPVWRNPDPNGSYDAVVIGGGGHGLATAYYLAKTHRVRRTAVLERGWLGETAWQLPAAYGRGPDLREAVGLYHLAAKAFGDLTDELGFTAGASPRPHIDLADNRAGAAAMRHAADLWRLWGGAAQTVDHNGAVGKLPLLNSTRADDDRHFEAVLYPDGGLARAERLIWAYARAADELGVDIVQDCEVSEFLVDGHKATGVITNRGRIEAPIIAIAAEGYASDVATAAGFGLPIRTHAIEVVATEPLAPVLDTVVTSRTSGLTACQMPTGEIVAWAGIGDYPSFSPWGAGRRVDDLLTELVRLLPGLGGADLTRRWSAIVDVTPDGSPLIGRAPLDGVFLNCGWGAAGYAALPASGILFAELLGRFAANDLIAPFAPSRFEFGAQLRPPMIASDLAVVGAPCF
jgi:sarcosine oxidase, subunit beta